MKSKIFLEKILKYREKAQIEKPIAISIIGLGKVGSAMLAAYADAGLKV